MTSKPKYRGTLSVMEQEKVDADKWFDGQLFDHMLADESISNEVKVLMVSKWFSYGFTIERTSTRGYSYTGEHDDYFYVWKIREPGTLNDKRFVIRKDGTLNLKSLSELVARVLQANEARALGDETYAKNKLIWDEHFDTEPDGVLVEMSREHLGSCRVAFAKSVWGFIIKRRIMITNVTALINLATNMRDAMKDLE